MNTKINNDLFCLCTATGEVFDFSNDFYDLVHKIEDYNWIHKQILEGHTHDEIEKTEDMSWGKIEDLLCNYDFVEEDFPLVIKKVKKEDLIFKNIVEVNQETCYL